MRNAIVALLALGCLALTGCAKKDYSQQDSNYCLAQGYAGGSNAHAVCRAMLAQQRQANAAAAIALYGTIQPAVQVQPRRCAGCY